MQTVALSKAPIIASHSAARALADHSRNMDDEQLLALKKNGGVAQAVALGSYVKVTQPSPERTEALTKLEEEFGLPAGSLRGRGGRGNRGGGRGGGRGDAAASGTGATGTTQAAAPQRGRGRTNPLDQLSPEKRAELDKRRAELDEKFPPPPRPDVKDFIDHIDYIVKKIGIDHVGISSDFDGGGGIEGWNDASETFNITLELVRRGYTEEQISKIWSGNLLRVMEQVQKIARQSAKS
jgi:membrane dipeptidase